MRQELETAVEAVPWETMSSAQEQAAPSQMAPPVLDPVATARQDAAILLETLPTLTGDAQAR
jgi:hypothetical protein